MATLRYFTRTSIKNDSKLSSIYSRLKDGKVDITTKTGIQIRPDHFNNASGKIRYKAEFTTKDKVEKTLRDLQNYILDHLAIQSGSIDKKWLDKTILDFHNPDRTRLTLFSFIRVFIDKAPNRIIPNTGRPVTYKQIREYERTFHYIKKYSIESKTEIDFDSVNLDFYYAFVSFLQSEGLAQNTIGKKIQTLKIFLNSASDAGITVNQQYKSHRFAAISEESENIYLDEVEINKIYHLDLSKTAYLDRVRDLFVIGCWTGLRYSDWDKIIPENIKDGFLELKQEKTGGSVVIPLHPTVSEILGKYQGELPTIITNQKFNEYLKLVAKKAGLTDIIHKTITKGGVRKSIAYPKHELVTTHTGRRSFATNLYKSGLPTYTIMQVTGHRTEAAFLKYIKVTNREHAEKLKQFWQDQVKLQIV